MREFFGTFNGHLKRGVLSPMFVICIAASTLLMILYVAPYYHPDSYRVLPALYYFLQQADDLSSMYFTMMVVAFTASILLYDDWKSGNFKFIISRVGRIKYTFAITLAAGLTAALVMLISYMLFSAFILVNFPALPDMAPAELRNRTIGFPNSGLLYTGHVFLCYLLYYLTRSAMAGFFAAFSVFQSMIITNRHFTAISPVLMYIFYFAFNLFYILPTVVNPFVLYWNGFKLYLTFGGTQDGNLFSPIAAIYPILFTVVTMMLLSLIEAKILRSKMNKSL